MFQTHEMLCEGKSCLWENQLTNLCFLKMKIKIVILALNRDSSNIIIYNYKRTALAIILLSLLHRARGKKKLVSTIEEKSFHSLYQEEVARALPPSLLATEASSWNNVEMSRLSYKCFLAHVFPFCIVSAIIVFLSSSFFYCFTIFPT